MNEKQLTPMELLEAIVRTADSKGYPYGKLYQWGRKYGQGYDDNDEIYPSGGYLVNGPVDLKIGQDEANAAKFYYSSATPYNWVSGFYGKLWNNGTRDNPIKSEYDPCPEGWRVPTQTEIAKLKAERLEREKKEALEQKRTALRKRIKENSNGNL